MYSKRTKLAKMSLLMIIMILFAVVFSGVMVLAEEQPEESLEDEQKEYEETIDWKSNTKNGEIDLSEGIDFGNGDWESETFVEEGAADVESSEVPEGNNTAATAVLAAVAGVLGATALTGKELLEKNKTSIIPKGNGIWVPEEDREKVEEMINKVANKEYFIDEEGFLNSVDDDEIDPSKSENYSRVLDKLIAGDRKVVVSIDNGWSFYNPDTDKTEKIDFEAQDGGISIGDNGTDQAVVISGETAELEDIDGNKIYGGSELLLAHELIHSLRGVYGLRNKDEDGGVNEDEEAHTIQLENKIRYELGYGLRGDGDSSDDVNQDGIADGDDTYGEYNDDEGTEDWFEDIEEKKGLMGLVGSIYNHYSKSYYYRKYKKYKEKYKSYYSKYRKYKKKYKKKKRSKYKRKYKAYYKKYKKYKERYKKYYKKYKEKSKDLKKDKSKKKNNSNSNSSKPKNSGNSTIPAWLDWDRDGKIDTKEDKKSFDKDNNGVADWVDEERKSNKSKSKEDKMTVVTNKTLVSSESKGGSSKDSKNTLDEILSFDPTYKYNENTEKLQKRLNELGYKGADGKPLAIDGKFGKNTLNAVNDFKEKNKLWNFGKYEGKVGNTTWEFLFPKKKENKSQENKSNSKIMDIKEKEIEKIDIIVGDTSSGEDTSEDGWTIDIKDLLNSKNIDELFGKIDEWYNKPVTVKSPNSDYIAISLGGGPFAIEGGGTLIFDSYGRIYLGLYEAKGLGLPISAGVYWGNVNKDMSSKELEEYIGGLAVSAGASFIYGGNVTASPSNEMLTAIEAGLGLPSITLEQVGYSWKISEAGPTWDADGYSEIKLDKSVFLPSLFKNPIQKLRDGFVNGWIDRYIGTDILGDGK